MNQPFEVQILEFVIYSFLNYRPRCLEHTDRSCSDSLFTLQVSGELDTVSETAQGVHALQNIRVQICKRQNPLDTHAPRGWLLWTRLVPAPSETERHTSKSMWSVHSGHFMQQHKIKSTFTGIVQCNTEGGFLHCTMTMSVKFQKRQRKDHKSGHYDAQIFK